MINIITGKPGTSKTYNLVRLSWKFLNQGKDVYSNFYINFDELIKRQERSRLYRTKRLIQEYFYYECNLKWFMPVKRGELYFWEKLDDLINIRGGEILIDECQIYFNNRAWKDLPMRLQYKFQQHRKHIKRDEHGKIIGLNIWGAVQNVKRIDLIVRELVNSVYVVKKLGRIILLKQYDIEDIDKEKRYCYSNTFCWFKLRLANSYDTFQEITGFTD
ncbi:MAG: zonular occludens toxin domain-containing protein [Candidatus Falkowbacteria bacterium]